MTYEEMMTLTEQHLESQVLHKVLKPESWGRLLCKQGGLGKESMSSVDPVPPGCWKTSYQGPFGFLRSHYYY